MMPCLGCNGNGMDRRQFLRSMVLLSGGMMGHLLRGHVPAWAFSVISEEQEAAMGRKAHQQILAQFGYYRDASLQAFVTQVGQRVLREAESSPFEFRFTIVDHPMVNAFAVPGGFVYVTRGILAELNSEAELATILGHEIAHVTSHHSAEQMTRAMGAQLLALGLAIASPGGAENRAGWAAISNEISTQILLGYGREAELESDEKGLRWAVKAGYDPRGMIGFLRSLQIRYRLSGIGYHALRASHPEILERIDRNRVMIEILTEKVTGPLTVNADDYKARLEGLVYGERREQKRVRVIAAPGGGSVKDIAKALWGTENRAWDLALLNGIRDQGRPLQPGEKIKMIYDPSEEPPPRFQDLSLSIR
ncbi:MAG: M48 family metalloprotease [Candidatus Methylomirabilales bacterium]